MADIGEDHNNCILNTPWTLLGTGKVTAVLHLHQPQRSLDHENGAPAITLVCPLEFDNRQAVPDLWFRVSPEAEPLLARDMDPFVVATLMLAMKTGATLRVHGPVTAGLLSNLEEFQSAWIRWLDPDLARIEIKPDEVLTDSAERRNGPAIMAFSGGVDSCYSAFRHARSLVGARTQPLAAGVLVHGFDIPLSHSGVFAQASARTGDMLGSLGMRMIPVATNYRDIMDPYLSWPICFGPGVVAALMLFKNGFATGLVAASFDYRNLAFPYGSNPVSDPLLGSRDFEIIHDGAEHGRFGKIRVIADWPEALQHLRVCWQGGESDYNCCRCEKCVRNILTFRILGVPRPECFPEDVTDQQIRSLRLKGDALKTYRFLRRAARAEGVRAPWLTSVDYAIARATLREGIRKRIHRPLKKAWRRLRSR